jgi:hypothetical protein
MNYDWTQCDPGCSDLDECYHKREQRLALHIPADPEPDYREADNSVTCDGCGLRFDESDMRNSFCNAWVCVECRHDAAEDYPYADEPLTHREDDCNCGCRENEP